MSGAPPPQQPPTCDECGTRKTTKEITLSNLSKSEESEVKHDKGAADFGSLSGGTNRKDSQTTGIEDTSEVTSTFSICQSPGCSQRGYDLWIARKWQMENDPSLDASPEAKEWEKQQIQDKEDELVEDRSDFFDNNQTDKQMEGVQETDDYGTSRNVIGKGTSRQTARDSSSQSNTQSRHSQDQNAATEWGNTPDNKDIPWSNEQAQASGWGNTDDTDTTAWSNAQASGTTASEQDTAQATDQDSTTETTTTAWGNPRESDTETTDTASDTDEETSAADTAFEQSVYGDSQMDSQGGTMANESPNGENSDKTNTETETERYNDNRSRNRSR